MTERKEATGYSPAEQPPPPYLWHAGRLVEWEKATTHITNMAWTSISMVFEGIRGYWNLETQELYLFQLDAHLRRLSQSMKIMRMVSPYSHEELEAAVIELVQANHFREDIYVSPFAYFSGGVPGYLGVNEQPGEALITSRPAPSSLAREDAGQVAHCCVSSWTRIADNVMPPRAKAVANYQNSRYVSTEARLNGYDFGIILNDRGKVAEAAYACIFIVRDGVAITPPHSAGILESITRASVLDLLQDMGIRTEEREMERTELYVADEAFLCGTAVEVRPVVSVDRYLVGDGEPGPITRGLQRRLRRVMTGEDASCRHWVTPVYGAR